MKPQFPPAPREWRRAGTAPARSLGGSVGNHRSLTVSPPAEAFAARVAGAVQNEIALVRLGLGVIALHIVDDNFLQPEPGTSAGDHLVSGLVPVAILAVVAAVYPRLRAGLRAAAAMTFGAMGVVCSARPGRTTCWTATPRATTTRGCSPSWQAPSCS